jgi:hypothetical protein
MSSEKDQALMRGTAPVLLALGLYVLVLGEAFFLSLLLWPRAIQDNAFLYLYILGLLYTIIGSLLILGSLVSLVSLKVASWWMVVGVALVPLLAAVGQGLLFPSLATPFIGVLIYAGVLVLLSLVLWGMVSSLRPLLWRTLLVAGSGAALVSVLLIVRGADDWKDSPYGLDVTLASLVVGVIVLIVGYRFAHRAREPQRER